MQFKSKLIYKNMKTSSKRHRRSTIPARAVIQNSLKMLSNPSFAFRLGYYQFEKAVFRLRFPGYKRGYAHQIRQLGLRITDLCNLRCHTCGQWGDNGYLRHVNLANLKKQEVSPERYRELLRDLKLHGHTPILYFWGGEPMLYKDLMDVIEEGAGLGMPPSIATNGVGVADYADRFVTAPVYLVQISVDGSTPCIHNSARPAISSTYDNFRDVQGALETLTGTKRKKKRSLPILASLTTVSKRNYLDLVNIYRKFSICTDVQVFYLSWWIDAADAQEHNNEFRRRFDRDAPLVNSWIGDWSKFDYNGLSKQLFELKRISSGAGKTPIYIMPALHTPAQLCSYYTQHKETFGYDECISIYQVAEIDSNGDMSPCRDYRDYTVGNVKDRTITELWNSPRFVKFRRSVSRQGIMPACTRCCGLMGY